MLKQPRQVSFWSVLGGIPVFILTVIFVFVVCATVFTYSNISSFYKIFLVQSGSMSPVIKTGDMILVKPESNYSSQDIITFKDDAGQIVTHRIQKILKHGSSTTFLTKGDANRVVDSGEVPLDYIIGKVALTIPYLGYLIVFAKSIPGLVIFIILPACAIIFSEINNIFKSFSKA